MSVSEVEIKMPMVPNTNNLYQLNFDMFQLSEGVIPLDVLHRMDHKTPKTLNVPKMNSNNTTCSLTKNLPIATLASMGRCEELQELVGSSYRITQPSYSPKYLIILTYS